MATGTTGRELETVSRHYGVIIDTAQPDSHMDFFVNYCALMG